MSTYRHLKLQEESGITIVHFVTPQLSRLMASELGTELSSLAEDHSKILLNFDTVESIDPSVMSELMELFKKMGTHNGELALCNMKKGVSEIFSLTRLDRMLNIYDQQKDGIAALLYN